MIVLALLAVNQYIAKSRRLWLVATIAAIIAAPLFWSGGLVAGFVAGVRLLTDRGTDRPSLRRAGRACLLLSLGLAVFIAFLVSRHGFPGAELRGSILRYPANAVVNSARAGMEGLLLGNLGIDAPLPLPATASVAVILLAVSLAAFRLRKPLLSPLGWAALTLIVSSYLLIYLFRGNLGWEALRPIVWYHGLAQVGLVLLLTGGLAARHKGRASLSRLDVLILTMVVLGLLRIHSTRVAEHVGDLRSIDRLISAPEAVQRLLRNERAFLQIYQEHSLAALDGIEEEARDLGAGREEVRQAGGPLPFPGWPPMLENHDPYDLLRLPPRSRGDVDIGRLRASMSQYAQYIRDQSAQAR
jgi:hypothetical protein